MLTLRDGYYILAVWFIGHDPDAPATDRTDWMAICFKETPEGPWRVWHRLCWHGHAGAADLRRWQEAAIEGAAPEAQVLDALEQAAMRQAELRAAPLQSVYIQGDVHRALALLQTQPWFEVLSEA
jgi:hypothetical protein